MSTIVKWRRLGLAVLDALLVALSLYCAYQVRYEFAIFKLEKNQLLLILPLVVGVRLLFFWSFKLYRGILRYAGLGEMVAIVCATGMGSAVLLLANLIVPQLLVVDRLPYYLDDKGILRLQRVSISILVTEGALTILLLGAVRFSRRILISEFLNPVDDAQGTDARRVLIVGAGDAGEAVARQMRESPNRKWIPVAFVDDDPEKQHLRIHRIPVAGKVRNIPEVIRKYRVDEVVVTLRKASPARLQEIVQLCEHEKVNFRILPSVQDVMTGRVSINQIRPVEIEDLLGRDEVTFELSDDLNYIRDEVVMITGAGGSIGSELCRQLLHFQPRQILLFGHGENSIYEIAEELNNTDEARSGPGIIVPIIGDIRDRPKLGAVADEYKPGIFFHAAAHKHVPLMEAHPDEAIKNNVTGTRNVATIAEACGARRFIMISSDKAVRPTNVMGASKRVAEMIVFDRALSSRTQFVAVRFGNVLGSRGSVVPLFRRQIAKGGPVTLTHPDVVRFFMTIPEAVSLVIQAGSMSEQRRLYLLDMGHPVKIVDLARNLIRLCGFEPDKDIQIKFTGLRPGEKLKEELLTAGENVKATGIGKIFSTEPERVDTTLLDSAIENLENLADAHDAEGIREALRHLVPDYGPEGFEVAEEKPEAEPASV